MSFLLGNTLQAALLALLVLAIARTLRPAPAVLHGLWLLLLWKLALPPLFELPIALPAWLRPAPAPAVVDALALLAPAPPPPAASGIGDLLPWAWLCGTVLLLALGAAGIVHGHRRVRRLGPVPAWLAAEVAVLAARLSVRVPRLCDDPQAHAPCIWSLFGTRLLLPAAALQRASPNGRAAVLAHELAHLRRRDHLVAHFELLLAAALWWHPLFWLLRRQLRLQAELACDAWALACVPGAAVDYAHVLVDAVAAPDSAIPGLTVLAARPAARAAFERRLTMILNEKVGCRVGRGWWLPLAAMGLGVLAAPVLAQEPVQVEVQVNGKSIDQLTPAERRAALRLLRQQPAEQAPEPGAPPAPKSGKRPAKAKPQPDADGEPLQLQLGFTPGEGVAVEVEGMPSAAQLGEWIERALQGLKIEVVETDEVAPQSGRQGNHEVARKVTKAIRDGMRRDGSIGLQLEQLGKDAARLQAKLQLLTPDQLPQLRAFDVDLQLPELRFELPLQQFEIELLPQLRQIEAELLPQLQVIEAELLPQLQQFDVDVQVPQLQQIELVPEAARSQDGSLQQRIERAVRRALQQHGVQPAEPPAQKPRKARRRINV